MEKMHQNASLLRSEISFREENPNVVSTGFLFCKLLKFSLKNFTSIRNSFKKFK